MSRLDEPEPRTKRKYIQLPPIHPHPPGFFKFSHRSYDVDTERSGGGGRASSYFNFLYRRELAGFNSSCGVLSRYRNTLVSADTIFLVDH